MEPTPHIALLNEPSVVGADGKRVSLERKTAALLAVLALDGRRPRSLLAAMLWPDAAAPQARNSLRQRLFRLQRAAGREFVVGSDDLTLANDVTHDLAQARPSIENDPAACQGDLLGALDYADSDALADWVDAARERWRRQRSTWLADVASAHETRGEIARALAYAQRLLGDEPLQEHAHRRVMRLHYLRGDRAAALASFERCRELLRDELGTTPDRETTTLARQIASADVPAMKPSTRPSAPPITVLRPPRLIGRNAQRQRLDAAARERRVLVLSGEPGIGKSRLFDDLASAHPDLLTVGAHAGEASLAYALLARLAESAHRRFEAPLAQWVSKELARLLPAFGAAPAARLDPLRLQQAFALGMQAWARRGLAGFVVDDLHHADDASLECLLAVADGGTAASAPASVVASASISAPAPAPPAASEPIRLAWILGVRSQEMPTLLSGWIQSADHGTVEVATVPPLDAEGVSDLLDSLALQQFNAAEWAAPLLAHSRGNPLFALETLRAMLALDNSPAGTSGNGTSTSTSTSTNTSTNGATTQNGIKPAHQIHPAATSLPVPAALNALIARRLARLSERALRLVRVAALAGANFDADVAAHVLQTHPLDMVEPWRELEQADLIANGRFTHDLIAEAAARELPAGIAGSLHARLAEALESLGRSAARVAPHWALAQAWPRAGHVYATAAREAQRASRRTDEIMLWEHAADCFDRAGQAGKAFDARGDSVESAIVVRGIEAARQLAERLMADAKTEPQRLRALTGRATVCLYAGDQAGGEASARAALESADQLGALWPRFEAARLLAVALSQAFRAPEALRTIEPFRDVVEAEGSLEQRHHFWADYAYVLKSAQRLRDTADALRKAMVSAQELGDYGELAIMTSNLAVVVSNFGATQEALAHGKRARALHDPTGTLGGTGAGATDLYIGVANGALGRYAEAFDDFDRAGLAFGGQSNVVWHALTANYRAMLLLQLGQYARARQTLEFDDIPAHGIRARRALLRARIDRALGGDGRAGVDEALAIVGPQGDHLVRMLTRLDATLAMPPAEAAELCSKLRAEAEALEHGAVAMRARLMRVDHLRRAGLANENNDNHAGADADAGAIEDRAITLRAELHAVAASIDSVQPADMYLPEAWWIIVKGFDALAEANASHDLDDEDHAVTDTRAAEAALARGHEWIACRALPNVPEPFRESFLHRNPINRDLLAAAARRLGLRVPNSVAIVAGTPVDEARSPPG